ncbi:MAG: hypothetical protein WD055_02205 [Candidatus Dependentiae bacterium]
MKKILLLLIVPFLINAAEENIIKNATYFKIHMPERTLIHVALGYRTTKYDADRVHEDIKPLLQSNRSCVSFYDRQWNIIQTNELNPDHIQASQLIEKYQQNLDPESRPEATYARITSSIKLGKSLIAFDAWDKPLCTVSYQGKPKLKEIKQRLNQIVDTTKLTSFENKFDKQKKTNCVIQ